MTLPVQPKRSFTPNRAPLASELEVSELAINWADKALYTKTPDGAIASIVASAGGSNKIQWSNAPLSPTSPATAGELAYNAEFLFVAVAANTWVRIPLAAWSVPVITITQQPTNQTAAAGGATFTVAATSSDGATISYQWQSSTDSGATWANLASETAATLTLSGLTASNSGEQYRALVSATGAASVYSDAATLTVNAADVDVSWYSVELLLPFDGENDSTTITDTSRNGLAITPAGNAKISTAESRFGGSSLRLAATGDYLSFSGGASIENGDFCIEFFARSPWNTDTMLFDFRPHASLALWTNGTQLLLFNAGSFATRAYLTSDTWQHIAVCRSGITLRLFVDGVEQYTTQDQTGYNIAGGTNWIGKPYDGNWSNPNLWLDEFRISRVARYEANFTPPSKAFGGQPPAVIEPDFRDVLLMLHLDGSDGAQSFADSSTYERTITHYGSAAISTAESKFGGASFTIPAAGASPISDRLEVSGNADFNFGRSSQFTIEAWIFIEAFNNVETILAKSIGGAFSWRFAAIGATGQLQFSSSTDQVVNSSNNAITANQWHHVAACRDGARVRLFVDGQLVGSGVVNMNLVTDYAVTIGNEPGSFAYGISEYAFDGFIDELRVTKAVVYPGANFVPPAAAFPSPLVATIPATVTVYGGAVTLSVTANTAGAAATYQWQKQEAGASGFTDLVGETSATLALANLTDADDTGDAYRVIVSVAGRNDAISDPCVITVDESGVNGDNRFRVTAAAATTSLTAAVDSTTGYWKMIASSGQQSSVFGSPYSQYSPYYFNTGTLSGLPAGAEKTVEVLSCDAAGSPSGELEYVSFAPSSQAIVAADASGCASLQGFNLSSSASPYQSFSGPSSLPAALVNVRAVGVTGSGGMYSQWNANYPPNVSGGINVAGQTLSAAALDQLYTDLGIGTNNARIFVPGNPGTSGDDPTIATAKSYTVFGS